MSNENAQDMPSLKDLGVKLDEFLTTSNIAEDLARQSEEAIKLLDFDDRKEILIKKLKSSLEVSGNTSVSEQHMDEAVERFAKDAYRYESDLSGIGKGFAKAYVNRKKIALGVGIPAAVILSGTYVAGELAERAELKRLQDREASVEFRVSQNFFTKTDVEKGIEKYSSADELYKLPSLIQADVDGFIRSASKNLVDTDEFFKNYWRDGSASETVTIENMELVDQKLVNVEKSLNEASEGINKVASIHTTQRNLIRTRQSLDSLVETAREITPKPPSSVLSEIENTYSKGISLIESRNVQSAMSSKNTLKRLVNSASEIPATKTEFDVEYKLAERLAEGRDAKEEVNRLLSKGIAAYSKGDISGLKKTVEELEFINDVLRSSYKLVVTGGNRRQSNDIRMRGSQNHYLLVRAETSNGTYLKLPIKNEETGRIEEVREWGERVPERVYNRVGNDKRDNGLIDDEGNTVFGVKRKGYLNYTVTIKDNNGRTLSEGGKITRWEDVRSK